MAKGKALWFLKQLVEKAKTIGIDLSKLFYLKNYYPEILVLWGFKLKTYKDFIDDELVIQYEPYLVLEPWEKIEDYIIQIAEKLKKWEQENEKREKEKERKEEENKKSWKRKFKIKKRVCPYLIDKGIHFLCEDFQQCFEGPLDCFTYLEMLSSKNQV